MNSITTKDSYSLPRIGENVEALSGAKNFTMMDVDRAFWQIGVAEPNKRKTAFIIGGKLQRHAIWINECFERLMDCVLRGLAWRQCLVYIDEVLSRKLSDTKKRYSATEREL